MAAHHPEHNTANLNHTAPGATTPGVTTTGAAHGTGRSTGQLLSDLSRDTTTLVQQEVALAKAELNQKITQVGLGIGSLVFGGAVLFAGLIVLLAAAVIGLNEVMEPLSNNYPWLSPLIIGVVVLLIGLALVAKGRSNLKTANLAPRRTINTLHDDKEFVKEQAR